jgi:hypothetical protein
MPVPLGRRLGQLIIMIFTGANTKKYLSSSKSRSLYKFQPNSTLIIAGYASKQDIKKCLKHLYFKSKS